ncbi:RNA polymerase sigma factor [Micromonospora sp. NBC_01638]|uniref:RNA polymerase sigma factor n=1 Tax=Micromonospora sp. NBC_01638 TaxID=2975982 RepID=UPI0038649CC2|nr:sigma-70 family RNA polymerase sigma factor [Micromonospora sp. NBC_01638]
MRDPTARLTDLFHRHADDVHAYARWRVGDADADDVVGEVFLVAWRSLDRVRPGQERAWLFGVARTVVLARRRQNAARVALTDRLSNLRELRTVEGPSEKVALRDRVRQALDRLGDADREVLVTVGWFDLSPAEAAKVLGVSRPTYAVRLHRARRRFRAVFDEIGASQGPSPAPATAGPRTVSTPGGTR